MIQACRETFELTQKDWMLQPKFSFWFNQCAVVKGEKSRLNHWSNLGFFLREAQENFKSLHKKISQVVDLPFLKISHSLFSKSKQSQFITTIHHYSPVIAGS